MSLIIEDRKQMRSGNWFSKRQKVKTSVSAEGHAKLVLGTEAQKGSGIENTSHLGRQEGVA